jgi:hypothetical protein
MFSKTAVEQYFKIFCCDEKKNQDLAQMNSFLGTKKQAKSVF